jgi:hypothetical protein
MPDGKSRLGMTALAHEFCRLRRSDFRIFDFLKRVRCGPLRSSYCDRLAHFSRLLLPRSRISRNSPGPLMRRRLLRSRSSGGRAGSILSLECNLMIQQRGQTAAGRGARGGADRQPMSLSLDGRKNYFPGGSGYGASLLGNRASMRCFVLRIAPAHRDVTKGPETSRPGPMWRAFMLVPTPPRLPSSR